MAIFDKTLSGFLRLYSNILYGFLWLYNFPWRYIVGALLAIIFISIVYQILCFFQFRKLDRYTYLRNVPNLNQELRKRASLPSIHAALNSKAKFEKFQPDSYLIADQPIPIEQLNIYLRGEQVLLKNNRTALDLLYERFQQETRLNPAQKYFERRLDEKIDSAVQSLKEIHTDFMNTTVLTLSWSYTSPAGRNQYRASKEYSLSLLETQIISAYHSKERFKLSKVHQRQLMTDKLRFSVFQRDNHTCQSCGRSPKKDGVTLHVDHIHPVSKGGKTILTNLQTLCKECNRGKGDRIVS